MIPRPRRTGESYGCWMISPVVDVISSVKPRWHKILLILVDHHFPNMSIWRFRVSPVSDKPWINPYRNRTYALSDCQCQAPQINHFVPAPTSSLKFISFSKSSVGVLWKWGTLKKHPKGLLGVSNFAFSQPKVFAAGRKMLVKKQQMMMPAAK